MELLESRTLLSSVTGSESLVNQSAGVTQNAASGGAVAANGSGSVAVWESFGQDAILTWGIMGRLFAADGSPSGAEFVVNANFVLSDQRRPRVAMGGDGTFVVVWEGRGLLGLFPGIYAQRFASDGTPIGTEIGVAGSAVLSVANAAVGVDSGGNFIIAYESTDALLSTGVFARRYAADGTELGTEFAVNVTTGGEQVLPAVAMAADGSFRIAWEGPGSGDADGGVFVRSFNSAGAATTGEVLVNSTATGAQSGAAIASRPDGGFWLAWEGNGAGDSAGIFVRRFDANTVAIGPETLVNTSTAATQQSAAVATDEDGDAVVAWSGSGSGDGAGVFVREFAANGTARSGGSPLVNTTTAGTQNVPSIAWRGNNRYVVLWNGNGVGDGNGVFGRFMENDAAVVNTTGSPLAYTENDGGVAVDPGLSITDADSAMLIGATVSISGNYVPGQDVLTFVNPAGITGVWVSVTGVLTLTGLASVAAYQAALRSVLYENTSDAPSTATRTVTFTVTDDAGDDANGNRSVTITAVNDAPEIVTTGTSVGYTENALPIVIDPGLTLSDADHGMLNGATVRMATNYVHGQDVLAFVNQAGITGSWDAATGTLMLSGLASVAAYQLALRSVTYVNVSDDPSVLTRTISFTISDGTDTSVAAMRDVNILPVNDAPTVATSGSPLAYTENDPATPLDPGVTLSDVDHALLIGATVSITGNYAPGQDVLAFTNQAGITGSWNALTGVLTLSGTASLAAYQAAMRSVTYLNNSEDPSILMRTVEFQVDDGGAASLAASRQVNITAVPDAPVVGTSGVPLAYTENDGPIVVDTALSVSDVDSGTLMSATVRITMGYVNGQDVLAFTDQAGISGMWNAASGTLTLTGIASLAVYQAALRSVTYRNTSENPAAATRSVEFQVSDGGTLSNVALRQVDVAAVNDAPVVGTTGSALVYLENAGATAIDPGVTISDVDSALMSGARVTVSGNYVSGEDVLAFVNQGGITGVWDELTGALTLTGVASVAAYQAALRAVTYMNTSDAPDTASRTVEFAVDDGAAWSGVGARTITIMATNDPPAVVTSAGDVTFTEGDPAVVMDAGLLLGDADDVLMNGASVAIIANYAFGQDVLSIGATGGITVTWNPATGTLTLSGLASIGAYRAALRSIAFSNNSENPSAASRTIRFSVIDAQGGSGAADRVVQLIAVNDAPQVTTSTGTGLFIEGGASVAVDAGMLVTDVDSGMLVAAMVAITGNYIAGEDALVFTNQSGITGSWNAATGVLTLTGSASRAAYQAALRSVRYFNVSDNPSTLVRTVGVVVSDGQYASALAARAIAVAAINDGPMVIMSGGGATFAENGAPVAVDAGITIHDVDSVSLAAAMVAITGNFVPGQDVLTFSAQAGITGTWNAATGVLTLAGNASLAAYQAALQSVMYANTSENPATALRTISVVVSDGTDASMPASRQLAVAAVPDPPVLTTSIGTRTYVENNAPAIVDMMLMLTDGDSATMTGATVRILSGFTAGEDRLIFTDRAGITGAWNATIGVLQLTGAASIGDYRDALRSVAYHNSSDAPATSPRMIRFAVVDDAGLSASADRLLTVVAVNDPPEVMTSPGHAMYVENSAPVIIDGAIIVHDVDNTGLLQARVFISGNYARGEDRLTLVGANGLSSVWDALSGTLTIIGAGTANDYAAALRLVAFETASERPSTRMRTIVFQVTDAEGQHGSAVRQVAVAVIADTPEVTTTTVPHMYFENAGPVPVDPMLQLTDADSTTLGSATVTFAAGYRPNEDILSFAGYAGLSGGWNATTATLTITGLGTVADYQAALRLVAYENRSNAPSAIDRLITFTATDETGQAGSANRVVRVVPMNDAPEIDPSAGAIEYSEHNPPVAIDPEIEIIDADSALLSSARVRVIGGYAADQDRLTFMDMPGIAGSWDAETGTLLLSGTATVDTYVALLRSVRYHNLFDAPSGTQRTIEVRIMDDLGGAAAASRTVAITPVNTAPLLSVTPNAGVWPSGGDRIVDAELKIADADSGTLAGAVVRITEGYLAGADRLLIDPFPGISAMWDAPSGVLTLLGVAPIAEYQAILRSIRFQTDSEHTESTGRTIVFEVQDELDWSQGAASTLSVAAASQEDPGDDSAPLPPDLGAGRPPGDETGEVLPPGQGHPEENDNTNPGNPAVIDPISSGSPALPENPTVVPRDPIAPAEPPIAPPTDSEPAVPVPPDAPHAPGEPERPHVDDGAKPETPQKDPPTAVPSEPVPPGRQSASPESGPKTPVTTMGRCVAVVRIGTGRMVANGRDGMDPAGRGALLSTTSSVVVASASVASALTGAYAVWTIGNVWAARRAARMIGDVWSLDLVILLKAWERQNPGVRFS